MQMYAPYRLTLARVKPACHVTSWTPFLDSVRSSFMADVMVTPTTTRLQRSARKAATHMSDQPWRARVGYTILVHTYSEHSFNLYTPVSKLSFVTPVLYLSFRSLLLSSRWRTVPLLYAQILLRQCRVPV